MSNKITSCGPLARNSSIGSQDRSISMPSCLYRAGGTRRVLSKLQTAVSNKAVDKYFRAGQKCGEFDCYRNAPTPQKLQCGTCRRYFSKTTSYEDHRLNQTRNGRTVCKAYMKCRKCYKFLNQPRPLKACRSHSCKEFKWPDITVRCQRAQVFPQVQNRFVGSFLARKHTVSRELHLKFRWLLAIFHNVPIVTRYSDYRNLEAVLSQKNFPVLKSSFREKILTGNNLCQESCSISVHSSVGSYLGGKLTCRGDLQNFCLDESYAKIKLFKMCFFRLFYEPSNILKIATTRAKAMKKHVDWVPNKVFS